jgi:anaerobic magnesium-protoporphyrin IX monomethyl ester cyclase
VWLYNLYNYVPYPLTPHFQNMRERIVDWDFANWREDGPPVFEPYHCSREESFDFFLEKVRAAHVAIRQNETRSGVGRERADGPPQQ